MRKAEARTYGIRLDEGFFLSREAKSLLREEGGTAAFGALIAMLFAAESRGGELCLLSTENAPVPITGMPLEGKAAARALGYAMENNMASISEDGRSVSFPVLSTISASTTAAAIRMKRMRSRREAENA